MNCLVSLCIVFTFQIGFHATDGITRESPDVLTYTIAWYRSAFQQLSYFDNNPIPCRYQAF